MEVTSRKVLATALAFSLVAACGIGALAPVSKLLLSSASPLFLAAVLALSAGLGMGVVWGVRTVIGKKSDTKPVSRGDVPTIALMAVLSAGALACLMLGVSYTAAENASLLMGFQVAAATACMWAFGHRSVCYKAVAAVGLMAIATIVLLWNTAGTFAFAPGAALVALAAVLWALESELENRLADRDAVAVTCFKETGAGALLLVATVATGGLSALPATALAGAIALGFVACGLGAALLMAARRMVGAARADGYCALAPFVGVVVSWACFGMALEPLFFGALAFMALGVWLAVDDSTFHEDAFDLIDREQIELYSGDAAILDFRHQMR